MRVDLVVVCVASVALSLPALSTSDPLFVMSAPNLLRVGSPEKVFVEAQDYTGDPLRVKVVISSFPTKNTIEEKTVTLTSADHFQQIVGITIPSDYVLNHPERKYVYLQANFPNQVLEKLVLLSFQSGYIFLQTDKTIYTPSTTVYYRIFALSPEFKPTLSSVRVDILNVNGIMMRDTSTLSPLKGVITGSFIIPDLVSFGTWSVVARFTHTPQKNFTAEFEVKEYVLPSFEISLIPQKSFYYVDDLELKVDISARYLYGKEVTGVGFVMFGVIKDGQKRTLPGSLQRVEIRNGEGEATLKREHIQNVFPNIAETVMSSIYVHVSVLTDTGSEMVDIEKRGIQIVTSPYTIHFKRTPKFFKPGMPFDVTMYVSNPDGSPAGDIPLVVTSGESREEIQTSRSGLAKITVNSNAGTSLTITARTAVPELSNDRQASQVMVARSYQPKAGSQNYLHIDVTSLQMSIGDQLRVTLNPRISSTAPSNLDVTYLVLSKGQIVEAKRIRRQGQPLLTFYIQVTNAMVPSFRIVAYYHVGSELVSDSVWVDVEDTCVGKLEIKEIARHTKQEPKGRLSLSISGDPGAKVGLVAVDKGVYVLNNKHRLTQTKIWDIVEKMDAACSAGSGKDSMGVFFDAGLLLHTSTAGGTDVRTVPTCAAESSRRRRAVTIMEVQTTAAKNYTGDDRQCCLDGMKKNILGYTCERRAEFILDGKSCVDAFVYCCKVMSAYREEEKEEYLQLARSDLHDEADMDETIEELTSRSYFPESWLWLDVSLPSCPREVADCPETSLTHTTSFPDSITNWQLSAVSISDTKGICVADTLGLDVKKDFFIDLKLPYSVVRYEQIEIRAIIHNNQDASLRVRLELYKTDDICSDATKTGKYRTDVEVEEMSTRAVPFVIVPLGKPGKYTIEVKAVVHGSFVADGIKKELLVVAEGVPMRKREVIELDPSHFGGAQTRSLLSSAHENRIPNTPANTYITVQGDELGITLQEAIGGNAMTSLIRQPGGCGEQNMFGITMPVTAANYLDKTNQWDAVGVAKRATALQYIQTGYNNQLGYRKADGSYGAFLTTPSSTWLTAYVAKVFSMAGNIITIQDNVICSALKWLILNRQQPDGTFVERAPVVYIKSATGDVSGQDTDASMTAFVLIAMQEGRQRCADSVSSYVGSMDRAVRYLEGRVNSLTNPYAAAMVSYALASAGKPNRSIFSRFISNDETHWPVPGNSLYTIEATAYALLTLVKMGEFEKAGLLVNWLRVNQNYGGDYASTQPTIMVFQAVAEYRVQGQDATGLDLQVTFGSEVTRTVPVTYTFTRNEAFRPRTEKFELTEKVTVTARGSGKGTLFVEYLYYAQPKPEDRVCKNFDLEVKLIQEPNVVYPQAKESFLLSIDMQFKSPTVNARMSILDITLLTGFVVDETDLGRLLQGRDRYVQKFEKDKKLSDRGSLILYLNEISHRQKDRIAFKVHRVMDVGLLQPAAVTVYEYYNSENRCVKFYHPQKETGELNKLCDKTTNICQCAEELCPKQRKTDQETRNRGDTACQTHIDYVIKAMIVDRTFSPTADKYFFRVEQMMKSGTDDSMTEGSNHVFIAHANCREGIDLQKGKSYLIMGAKQDVHRVQDSYQFVLGEQTWVEYWPTQVEAQDPEFGDRYVQIQDLVTDLEPGCSQ
ncbi:hypothetical protein ACEWY4_018014 [Coilia grayii]|uniref:Uncharacterized protein n=1 Tax=Coilia grayii TaxID=363190 RepID=A0ABD1JKQ9_9TELE